MIGTMPISEARLLPAAGGAQPHELMGEAPHLPVVSQYLKEADERIKRLGSVQATLEKQLADGERSILFLEGESDKLIIEAAWRHIIGGEPPLDIESSSGTRKMESLAQDGHVLNRLAPRRTIFVLVDNDKEGRDLYKQSRLDGGGRWVRHNSNGSYWCRLAWTADFRNSMERLRLRTHQWPMTLENLFTPELRLEAELDGCYSVAPTPHAELLDSATYPILHPVIADVAHRDRFYVCSPAPECKLSFAEWIVHRGETDGTVFEPLRDVLQGLQQQLQQDVAGN